MSLQKKLTAFKSNIESGGPPANLSPNAIAVMHRATSELLESGIMDRILKPGEKAPKFSLPNANGKMVNSKDLLAKGNLVIIFYRGAW
jgi:hypothetical protein